MVMIMQIAGRGCRVLAAFCQKELRRHPEEENPNCLVQDTANRCASPENARQLRSKDGHQKAPQRSRR